MFYYLKTNKSILTSEVQQELVEASEEFNNISGTYGDNCIYTEISESEILLNVGFYSKNGSIHREKYPTESEVNARKSLFGEENVLTKEQATPLFPTDV